MIKLNKNTYLKYRSQNELQMILKYVHYSIEQNNKNEILNFSQKII